MRPLDADMIEKILKALEGAEDSHQLYALETAEGVVLTNQQLLLEWPHEAVEPCEQLDVHLREVLSDYGHNAHLCKV